MKTRFLFAILAILLPLVISATTVKVDGLYYEISSSDGINTAEVIDNPNRYSGDITIPESIIFEEKTYNVTSIGDGAFEFCSDLTSVTIPNSVTTIGDMAFRNCFGQITINIPNSVTHVGEDAFEGTTWYDNQPDGVVYVGRVAYKYKGEGTTVEIKEGTVEIAIKAFESCSDLTSVTIPNSVTTIGDWAFHFQSSLTSVILPKSVTSIGYGAFSGCSGLTSITILNSVTSIGGSAFSGTAWYNNQPDGLVYVGKYAYTYKGKMPENTSITIKDGTLEIAGWAFYNCSGLTSITIPNSVTSIGEMAFYNCSGLTSITIPNSVTSIGYQAFYGCSGLKDVYLMGESVPITYNSFVSNDIDDATLHAKDYMIETLKEIEPWKSFKEIVVDEKVTDFNLTYYVDGDVYKTETHKYDDEIVPEMPTRKGMTFSGWDELPEKMPGKDVDVKGTFSWSKNTVDNVIYEVSDTINNYCKAIGNESASGAINIAETVDFDFSYNVTTITDNAFNGCKDITSIEIPATVTTIGERTFASIDKLTDVTIYAEDVPETDRTAFENSYIEDYVTLHVPAASIDKYKEVAPWKNFKSIVAIDGTEEDDNTEEGDDVVNPEEGDTDETNVGEEVIPVSGAKQTTWCSAYDLDFTGVEGVKAYIASGYDRETGIIWLTRVNKVPAGEGILIIADKGDYTIPHVSTSAYYANLMVGTLKAMVLNETDGEYTNYYLSNGTSGVGFYKVNGSVDIKANRAYLPLLKGTTKANTRFIGIGFEDEDGTTGIEIQSSIFNLQSKDVYYNLQGQRVDNPCKGIYIRNGKKVIVR